RGRAQPSALPVHERHIGWFRHARAVGIPSPGTACTLLTLMATRLVAIGCPCDDLATRRGPLPRPVLDRRAGAHRPAARRRRTARAAGIPLPGTACTPPPFWATGLGA